VCTHDTHGTHTRTPTRIRTHSDTCKDQIVGTRHKCKSCKDYDLCDACYEKRLINHDPGTKSKLRHRVVGRVVVVSWVRGVVPCRFSQHHHSHNCGAWADHEFGHFTEDIPMP